MYQHIQPATLFKGERFQLANDPTKRWYKTTNEPFEHDGKTCIPCTYNNGRDYKGRKSALLKLNPGDTVIIWNDATNGR